MEIRIEVNLDIPADWTAKEVAEWVASVLEDKSFAHGNFIKVQAVKPIS
jgi:hypothetical protein